MKVLDQDWVVCPKPRPSAAVQLFCFPNAGAGGSAYRGWADGCHPELEVTWVLFSGRDGRMGEKPYTNIHELVPVLVDAIQASVNRNFVFYGHSLGAKIAFEAARELRRRGQAGPSHLFVGACHAPQLPLPYPAVHLLEEGPFIQEMQTRYSRIPIQVIEEPELRTLLIGVLKADMRLVETYDYRPELPLDCAITAFGGSTDNTVDRSAIEAWKHQTRSNFQLHIVPGDHFFLQSARDRLLDTIAAELLLLSPGAAAHRQISVNPNPKP
jgi:medium-chain acyl-[acyl-carrier-protein] hydrolase